MGVWEYRVVERVASRTHADDAIWYEIIEVYYDDDGKLDATSDKICPAGDTVEDLREDLELMLIATNKPVISHEELDSNNET
jgi:hypothetical protein